MLDATVGLQLFIAEAEASLEFERCLKWELVVLMINSVLPPHTFALNLRNSARSSIAFL